MMHLYERRLRQGRSILIDWLGEGGEPVPLAQAQVRADICLRCPKNYKGSWLWNIATGIAIQSQMQLRETMAIKLENEDGLGVCEVCGCKLKLKVHVPFSHIYRHTPDEQFQKYPDFCWQTKERQQLQQANPS